MRKQWLMLALVAALLLATVPVWAQTMPVRGTITEEGKPVAGAEVLLSNKDTGAKYNLKTDKRGEFVHIAIALGIYDMSVKVSGVERYTSRIRVGGEEKPIVIDLAKEQAAAQERGLQQLTPEQRKQLLEKVEAEQREAQKVTNLNQRLAEAKAAEDAGNYEQAAAILNETTQMDPTRPLLWARLGQAHLNAAGRTQDRAAASNYHTQAAEAYKKAIALSPSDGGYHNNLGQSYAKLGKTDEAIAEYNTAAQVDPTRAGMYYFNLGAVLTNAGKVDDANAAFDKALASDPAKAEAYYWKGVNLLAKATIGKDNKMVAPPGTAENLNKYLELQPQGQYAQAAKELLASMGAEIDTTYKKRKSK
jgi:tetratricopeptide (TPR) repeat protein